MINQILEDLISSVNGARAVIFLDGDGESIAQTGDTAGDIRLIGAWKEIQLDRIREITRRLSLGDTHAVLFSLEEGNELIVPVSGEYCLLLFLSTFADLRDAMTKLKDAVGRLRENIE